MGHGSTFRILSIGMLPQTRPKHDIRAPSGVGGQTVTGMSRLPTVAQRAVAAILIYTQEKRWI
ncbi:hypothetical protein BDW42DRAFT_177317 [Aspergillus taichungensis]|uniref:Uncharacterized protein n=1 Tax=Aspergillus taichungensis TaxID=482145 RepID=A0A2J5HJF5_9EURO|nr:hypothetical protein BDW42DRAFT_177317 [Aspergillus taichungensis]